MTNLNITAVRGDTFRRKILITDANKAAVDITGWTIFFTLKNNPKDSDAIAVIKKDITAHTDPTGGESLIELTATETDGLSGNYFYDIQIKKADSDIRTVCGGSFTMKVDITRRTA